MAGYTINNTAGDNILTLNPGTLDNANCDIALFGMGYPLWGEYLNENLLKLTETFACPEQPGSSPPTPQNSSSLGPGFGINNPIIGQQWFNTTRNLLYVYTASGWSLFDLTQGGTINGNLLITGTLNINSTLTALKINSGSGGITSDAAIGINPDLYTKNTGLISADDSLYILIDKNDVGPGSLRDFVVGKGSHLADGTQDWLFAVRNDGRIRELTDATVYAGLVTDNRDIPNKKYVDDNITAATSNFHEKDDILTITGNATGNANTAYVEFNQSNGTRTGIIGDASTTTESLHIIAERSDLYLISTNNDIIMQPGGGKVVVTDDTWAYLDIKSSAINTDPVLRLFTSDSNFWSFHSDNSNGNILDIRYNNNSLFEISPVDNASIKLKNITSDPCNITYTNQGNNKWTTQTVGLSGDPNTYAYRIKNEINPTNGSYTFFSDGRMIFGDYGHLQLNVGSGDANAEADIKMLGGGLITAEYGVVIGLNNANQPVAEQSSSFVIAKNGTNYNNITHLFSINASDGMISSEIDPSTYANAMLYDNNIPNKYYVDRKQFQYVYPQPLIAQGDTTTTSQNIGYHQYLGLYLSYYYYTLYMPTWGVPLNAKAVLIETIGEVNTFQGSSSIPAYEIAFRPDALGDFLVAIMIEGDNGSGYVTGASHNIIPVNNGNINMRFAVSQSIRIQYAIKLIGYYI